MKILHLIPVLLGISLLSFSCSNEPDDQRGKSKSNTAESQGSDAKKNDDSDADDQEKVHAGVDDDDIDPEAPTTAVDQALVNRILNLEPLEQGHFMATLAASPRAFHPTREQGAWGAFGVEWKADNPTAARSGGFNLEFTAPADVALECRVGNDSWASCSNKIEIPSNLDQGYEEAHIRAKDSGILVASYRFRIDSQGPSVFFVEDVASGLTKLMGNEILASATCRADQVEVECLEGFDASTTTGVIAVTAKDQAGNETAVDLTP